MQRYAKRLLKLLLPIYNNVELKNIYKKVDYQVTENIFYFNLNNNRIDIKCYVGLSTSLINFV